jgi:hypothetical protein
VQVDASATKTRITGLTNGGSYTFRVTATNAAGTSAASGPSNAVTPLNSILDLRTPSTLDANDTKSVVLGVKFKADVGGTVAGVRFYKSVANTGTHVGSLYSATGQLLGQSTFAGESSSGWQTVKFATPVTITAGTTYVVAYLAPKGHYSLTSAAFSPNPFDNPPLHALANSASPNGVFSYSSTPIMPTSSFNSSNYWVDLLFAPGS